MSGNRALQRVDHAAGVVDAQRGLGDVGDRRVRVGEVEPLDIGLGLHEDAPAPAIWPIVPSTSGWPAWPIRITVAALRDVALALVVHLGRPAGRWRRSPAGRARRPPRSTALATPWALKMVTAPGGISSSSSTKRAPLRAGSRRHAGCARSRGGHRPAGRTSRAPALRRTHPTGFF